MQQINFYAQFINDPNALANGYSIIKQYLLSSIQHRRVTLQNLLNPNVPVLTLVGNIYPCEIFTDVNQQEKGYTRVYLAELLVGAIKKDGIASLYVINLLRFIDRIHKIQGYQQWINLYIGIIQSLPIHTLPQFFIKILQDADNRIHPLASKIYEYTIMNHNTPGLAQHLKVQQMLEILYYCIKSFAHLQGTLDNDEEPWKLLGNQNLARGLLDFVWGHLKTNPQSMKYSLKILTILFSDLQIPIENDCSKQIIGLGFQILHNFLSIIKTSSTNYNSLEEDEDQFDSVNPQTLLTAILHQYLELVETMMDNSDKFNRNINISQLVVITVLGSVISKGQAAYWDKYSDQYLLAIQDEGQRTLRNRCCQFIGNLVRQYSPHRKHSCFMIKQLLKKILQVAPSTHTSQQYKINQFCNFICNLMKTPINLLPNIETFHIIEQAFYYILMSCITDIFTKKQKKQLVFTIGNRVTSISQGTQYGTLLKICCLEICIAEIQTSHSANAIAFLMEIVKSSPGSLGVVLTVSRGLAKCAIANSLQISEDILHYILLPCIQYIKSPISFHQNQSVSNSNEQIDNAAHIPLQLFEQLLESSPNNRQHIQTVLDPQTQVLILDKYLHDGMVCAIVIKVVENLANPQVCKFLLEKLMKGEITDERIGLLLGKWVMNKNIYLNGGEISYLLGMYRDKKRPIIQTFISSWLKIKLQEGSIKNQSDENLIRLINQNPDSTWLVYMLRSQILYNPQEVLVRTIKEAVEETSFPSEFQNKMALPFYMGLNYTEQFMKLLSSVQLPNIGNLYEAFMKKFLQYADFFQGDHLKIIASLYLVKMCRIDQRLIPRSVQITEKYGNLEDFEWEDAPEEGEQLQNGRYDGVSQEQIIKRMLGTKIVNDELEKQLQEIFPQYAWSSELVQQKVAQLKSMKY